LNFTSDSAASRASVKAERQSRVVVLRCGALAVVELIVPVASITVWNGLALWHARHPELIRVTSASLLSNEPVASRNFKAERSFVESG